MYGLIAKITVVAGQRDALAGILIDGTASMPGCLQLRGCGRRHRTGCALGDRSVEESGQPPGLIAASGCAGRDREGAPADRGLQPSCRDCAHRWSGHPCCGENLIESSKKGVPEWHSMKRGTWSDDDCCGRRHGCRRAAGRQPALGWPRRMESPPGDYGSVGHRSHRTLSMGLLAIHRRQLGCT